MKNLTLLLVCLSSLSLYGQEAERNIKLAGLKPDKNTRLHEKETATHSKAYISLGLSVANGSFNDYKVGNANQFYQFLLQDPSLKLDDGALGYKYIGIGALMIQPKTVFGFDFNFLLFHPTHAIAGQDISLNSGLNASMHFGLKAIDMGFRFGPKLSESGANLSVEIGMLYGFMNGSISQGLTVWQQKGALGTGFRGGLAIDMPIKGIIIMVRVGYRYMPIDEKHVDPTDGKKSSFYANGSDGATVIVDWSGAYASIGLGLLLHGKKKD